MTGFLKCDAAGCDHIENVDAIVAEMVGKACPKCGASLLTQDDWEHYDKYMRPTLEAMEALGLVKKAGPGEAGAVRVHYHDGKLSLSMPKP